MFYFFFGFAHLFTFLMWQSISCRNIPISFRNSFSGDFFEFAEMASIFSFSCMSFAALNLFNYFILKLTLLALLVTKNFVCSNKSHRLRLLEFRQCFFGIGFLLLVFICRGHLKCHMARYMPIILPANQSKNQAGITPWPNPTRNKLHGKLVMGKFLPISIMIFGVTFQGFEIGAL